MVWCVPWEGVENMIMDGTQWLLMVMCNGCGLDGRARSCGGGEEVARTEGNYTQL